MTVEELTLSLMNKPICDFPKILRKAQLSLEELHTYATWELNAYTRNCLARNEKFEIILLCWDSGAQTPIHDHGGKDCWVYQVQGCIDEIRFEKIGNHLTESNRINIQAGGLSFINDKMGYHAIHNNSGQKAMSLHIYASPIDSCMVFNKATACFEEKNMSYNSYKDKESRCSSEFLRIIISKTSRFFILKSKYYSKYL